MQGFEREIKNTLSILDDEDEWRHSHKAAARQNTMIRAQKFTQKSLPCLFHIKVYIQGETRTFKTN